MLAVGLARPGRLGADVQDVGARRDHRAALRQRRRDDLVRRRARRCQSVAGERVGRDVDDAHQVRPLAPAQLGSHQSSSPSGRSCPERRRPGRASRPPRRGSPAARRSASAGVGARVTGRPRPPRAARRAPARSASCAPGSSTRVKMKRGSSGARARRTAPHPLAAHRAEHDRRPPQPEVAQRRAPAPRRRPGCARRRAARARGRCVPRRAARAAPASAPSARPRRMAAPRRRTTPRRSAERVEQRERHRRVVGLVRPEQPDAQPGELGATASRASTTIPSQPDVAERRAIRLARPGTAERHAERAASVQDRAQPAARAPVTARLPGLMIGAFSPPIAASVVPEVRLVVALDVRDRRHAEVEHVRGVEPAAHARPRRWRGPRRRRASSMMAAAVSASNSVGGPTSAATRSMAGRTRSTAAANSAAADRLTVDRDPLAIADEVRLRHGARRAARRRRAPSGPWPRR